MRKTEMSCSLDNISLNNKLQEPVVTHRLFCAKFRRNYYVLLLHSFSGIIPWYFEKGEL